MWDDTGSSNAEFANAVRVFSLKDVTFLEARFLDLIEYNLNVSRQLYTTCYFELRDLCESQVSECVSEWVRGRVSTSVSQSVSQ